MDNQSPQITTRYKSPLDFIEIYSETKRRNMGGGRQTQIEIYPACTVDSRSEDIMIRGGDFYAVWNPQENLWSTNIMDVVDIIDDAARTIADEWDSLDMEMPVIQKCMRHYETGLWSKFLKYVKDLGDDYHELDRRIAFANTELKKEDYASFRLPYSIGLGSCASYEKLMQALYQDGERQKLEWAVGAIISGDSKWIQKLIVLYGAPGTGKSTWIRIVQGMFNGYWTTFDAAALGSSNAAFALESFRSNPLIAIEDDGDFSRMDTNTRLNSLVSHETMLVNEKRKQQYSMRFDSFLIVGTNKPVRITDARSGVLRRLIDVHPRGNGMLPVDEYNQCMSRIPMEYGAIAQHCLNVYHELGPHYYDSYVARNMMSSTNDVYNFVEDYYDEFRKEDGTTAKVAWERYKTWADEVGLQYRLPRRRFVDELKNYFEEYREQDQRNGLHLRKAFFGFKKEMVFSENDDESFYSDSDAHPISAAIREAEASDIPDGPSAFVFDSTESVFDTVFADCPAQYATKSGTPSKAWDSVTTVLADLDTSREHYVRIPSEYIVIDFDLKDESGEKSLERNLEAISKWPATYAELSRSGQGVHLHYRYLGDPDRLAREYDENIEIKVFVGKQALRRKLTKCNRLDISAFTGELPLRKEGKKVINFTKLKNEKALRTLIGKNLRKEIHPGTKPSIDFIYTILEDAYKSDMSYDVSDLYQDILVFGMNSSHHADHCVDVVNRMHMASKDREAAAEAVIKADIAEQHSHLMFYDVEIFPNLFVVCFKQDGVDGVMELINPGPKEIESLLKFNLVGFNNRRYDNHLLYGALLGLDPPALYDISQRIIAHDDKTAFFPSAYNLSFADIYDFSSKKQSLKKFEIELGIHHHELGLPWDEPVPKDKISEVVKYCKDDVRATEEVFNARKADWEARQLLASLSGLSCNDTTRAHVTKIIFGSDRNPQSQFVYTDLSEMFPGYTYERGVSTYKGVKVGEGGYVWSRPGIWHNVALLDIASMHPTSLHELNLFGDRYTKVFWDIVQARLAIKHRDLDLAKTLLDGKLAPYLENASDTELDQLAYALKIVINSVYGLTAAKFPCEFKDPRNKDNIVAKRGALFMVDLKEALEARGAKLIHIKTDSVKIADATPEDIEFVNEFGKRYGYTFEHEATYSDLCLVNDAVYVARDQKDWHWTATGTQFQVPYVFKTLFSHEPLEYEDYCETKSVTGDAAMYLDLNENLPEGEHRYRFVGRVGEFVPIVPGAGGGELMCLRKSVDKKTGETVEKYVAVTGTKGFRWRESETLRAIKKEDNIDFSYWDGLVDKAKKAIEKYGSFEEFVSDIPF